MLKITQLVCILSLFFCAYSAPALEIPTDQISNLETKGILPCLHILCLAIQCENPIPTFSTFDGQICQACPRCRTGCPAIKCAAPPCDNPRPGFMIVDGQKCPGCPYCPVECPVLNCPTVICEDYQQSFITNDERQCPGCPRCTSPTSEQV